MVRDMVMKRLLSEVSSRVSSETSMEDLLMASNIIMNAKFYYMEEEQDPLVKDSK